MIKNSTIITVYYEDNYLILSKYKRNLDNKTI